MGVTEEIESLKRERNAVILAHNYQRAEVQDVADFTGDSLELARKAAQTDAEVIVFCGVYFMAETAAVLNPGRKVLIPDPSAGCAMADMVTAADVRALKEKNPGALAVCYVNSTAEVKAECDICVTSGNAEKILSSLPADRKIVFVPDKNLGAYVAGRLGREYVLFDGWCPVHASLDSSCISEARKRFPGAEVLVHPECSDSVRAAADRCLSTGGMCAYVRTCPPGGSYVIGTEVGIMHRLQNENPKSCFHALSGSVVCPDMKKVTLGSLLESLRDMKTEVVVDKAVAEKARRSIEAMLELS